MPWAAVRVAVCCVGGEGGGRAAARADGRGREGGGLVTRRESGPGQESPSVRRFGGAAVAAQRRRGRRRRRRKKNEPGTLAQSAL